jgi:hypothetical protein
MVSLVVMVHRVEVEEGMQQQGNLEELQHQVVKEITEEQEQPLLEVLEVAVEQELLVLLVEYLLVEMAVLVLQVA